MRSLPEAREASPMEMVTAAIAVIGFVVCSVIFAKVAYAAVALFLHGAANVMQVSLY